MMIVLMAGCREVTIKGSSLPSEESHQDNTSSMSV